MSRFKVAAVVSLCAIADVVRATGIIERTGRSLRTVNDVGAFRERMRVALARGDASDHLDAFARDAVARMPKWKRLWREADRSGYKTAILPGAFTEVRIGSSFQKFGHLVVDRGVDAFAYVRDVGASLIGSGDLVAIWKREGWRWKILLEDARSPTR